MVGGSGVTHIIRTVKVPTRSAASPLTSVIGSVVGVEPPFTVHAIIGSVDKRGKGRAAIKMIIGFQYTDLMRGCGSFEYQKKRFHPGHHQQLILRPQRLLNLAKLWQTTGTLSYSHLLM